MQILDFIKQTDLLSKNECEKAKLLCFYHMKETDNCLFSMTLITDLFVNCGLNAPNSSRLKNKLIKGKDKAFIESKGKATSIKFIPMILQTLEEDLGYLWKDSVSIISDSELLDETKFCGKRQYLDRLIHQINHTYSNNCYDATAVLMRRLFEIVLVLSYQKLGIENEIKNPDGSGYLMLERIVANAKNNQTLCLSRIKNQFDTFRMVGNFSAHSITYTAGKKDIDDIKLNYRVMLEELYNKAGII